MVEPYCSPTRESWIALLIFSIATIGFIVNTWNCFMFYLNRQNRNSFSYLWMSRCASNAIILFVFMFYESPTLLCNRQFPTQKIGYFIGNTTGTYYLAILLVQMLLATHRFMASMTHRYYFTLGTTRNTLIQLAVVWIIGGINTVQWLVESCEFFFDLEYWSWEEQCESELLIQLSTAIPVKITIVTVIVLNISTYVRLHYSQRRTGAFNQRTNHRLKSNFRLLFHGTIQDGFYLIDIINQEYTSLLSESKWWMLLCFSISWELVHVCDGIAMLVQNEDLRRPILLYLKKSKPTSIERVFTVSKHGR